MAIDETKMAALDSALANVGAADAATVSEAIDFLNAYPDVGVWDAGSGQFTFVDAGRARLLANLVRFKREKETRSCPPQRRR